MNWLKKIIKKLDVNDSPSEDTEDFASEEISPKSAETNNSSTAEKPTPEKTTPFDTVINESVEDNTGDEEELNEEEVEILIKKVKPTNKNSGVDISNDKESSSIIQLEEVTIKSIVSKMTVLKYSDTKLSGLNFHFRLGRNTPDSLAGSELFKSTDFRENLFRELEGSAIKFDTNLDIKLIYNSENIDQTALVNTNIGLEVLTPVETHVKYKGVLQIDEGIAWQDEYILEPEEDKIYKIGRGKNPKLPNSLRINNDIAFVSLEENPDPKHQINNNVSRSIAIIFYDKESNNFVLKRSELMNNLQHIIKVFSISPQGKFSETNLSHPSTNHILKDDDQIIINDKISMAFNKQKI